MISNTSIFDLQQIKSIISSIFGCKKGSPPNKTALLIFVATFVILSRFNLNSSIDISIWLQELKFGINEPQSLHFKEHFVVTQKVTCGIFNSFFIKKLSNSSFIYCTI